MEAKVAIKWPLMNWFHPTEEVMGDMVIACCFVREEDNASES